MHGRIEVISGPMFSGKTAQLILRVRQFQDAGLKVQVFKPRLDDRYGEVNVESHAGLRLEAVPLDKADEILDLLCCETKLVAVDEAQFFDPGLVDVCLALAANGRRVVVAGLDMDYCHRPFGPMPQLMAVADCVEKLTAICTVCGEPASLSQRLINGAPASAIAPQIVIGAGELYQPRCHEHHLVPEG